LRTHILITKLTRKKKQLKLCVGKKLTFARTVAAEPWFAQTIYLLLYDIMVARDYQW